MAALVVHASKDGESRRTLYTSPVIAVAKARSLFKTGWEDVHIVDADGGLFYPDKFDQLLSFDRKPARAFWSKPLAWRQDAAETEQSLLFSWIGAILVNS